MIYKKNLNRVEKRSLQPKHQGGKNPKIHKRDERIMMRKFFEIHKLVSERLWSEAVYLVEE